VSKCEVPPVGWSCSRVAGHDGPCAARPALVETGWLIERQVGGRGVWWRGTRDCGRDWTTDSCEAVRFARREDASRVLGLLTTTPNSEWCTAIATEHMWCKRTEEQTT